MQQIGILFDLDGTVLNTDLLIKKSFIHVFEKYKPGYQLSEEELLAFLGPSLHESFARYFDQSLIEELIDYYREFNHAKHEDYVTMYPYVKETLGILKQQGYPLAVVTTKFKIAALIGLDLFDLTKYFDVIVGLDDVECTKPDPEGILVAMEKLHVSKAIMIGDNVTDIMAGKNAGVDTIAVKWSPKGYQDMADLKPNALIDEISEVITYVERMKKDV